MQWRTQRLFAIELVINREMGSHGGATRLGTLHAESAATDPARLDEWTASRVWVGMASSCAHV